MKNILIIGAGACGLSISRLLSAQTFSVSDVVIATPDNISEHEKGIKKQSQFEQESIAIVAQPRFEEYIPTRQEIESHPFQKFIGKQRGKKSRW